MTWFRELWMTFARTFGALLAAGLVFLVHAYLWGVFMEWSEIPVGFWVAVTALAVASIVEDAFKALNK